MLLDPSADVFSFVCLFFFIFVVPLPSSQAEVRGQGQFRSSSSRPEIRRVAQILSLRSADVLATKLAAAAAGEPGGRFFFVFRAGKLFFFFSVAVVFVFLPRLTGIRQEVRREQEEELCLPRSSGDGRDLLSRPLICNRNLFVFLPPFYRPPQCCATCVTAEFCTTKLNQKERNGYMSLYIYIKKIYRYINATTKKTSGF